MPPAIGGPAGILALQRTAGNAAGGGDESDWAAFWIRRSVEDGQVEPAEALAVGEDVHLDDPSASDREARDRERPPVLEGDGAGRAVDERRPHLDVEAREGERPAGHVGRSADNPRRADGNGAAVGPEDHVRVE